MHRHITPSFCSIVFSDVVIKPSVLRLLSAAFPAPYAAAFSAAFARLHAVLWLLPAYLVVLFVSYAWYNNLAEQTALEAQREAHQALLVAPARMVVVAPAPERLLQVRRRGSRPADALTQVAQGAYWSLLIVVFSVTAAFCGHVPVIGGALKFFALSALHALYCFDYRWSLHGVPLDCRINVVEDGWAYFLGFGAGMALVLCSTSLYVGAAVVGLLFPFYIIAAVDADPKAAHAAVQAHFRARGRAVRLVRLPVLWVPATLTNLLLALLASLPRLWRRGPEKSRRSRGTGRAPARRERAV